MPEASILQKAASVLEWDRVLDVLARHAHSATGAERCRTLHLENDLGAAQARLDETGEMVALAEQGEPFPSLAFPDLRHVLDRATKSGLLEVHELRDFSIVLGLVTEATRFLGKHRVLTPKLQGVAGPLQSADALFSIKVALDRAIDSEGNIRESASPDLRRLSHHAQDLKRRMRHRLDVILESHRYAEVLQEHYFAQREGRYVVPVKAEMRSRIPGIVHDLSASGATVFLEPRELVDLNNAIKVAELDVEREVRRILKDLSALVTEHAAVIREAMEILAALDCISAKAAFSHVIKGRAVSLNVQGRMLLRQARHPLLVLAREHVVANDVVMDQPARVLVISGPNTGGKTVTLKMVGLFALMVRAGLQLPCGPDSEMAVFPQVFADIGDPQDLARDLSSFSAHMTQMIELLQEATAGSDVDPALPSPRSLVLLDELATSTEPAEGAALAEGLLVALSKLSMKVIVTTHYNALKVLAQTEPGFGNASLEFNVSTLAPTYRVIMGLPGGSSAIEIAGRLGLDERILEHARGLLHREDQVLDRVLSDLQETRRRLDDEQARVHDLRVQAEQAALEAQEIAERLRVSEREERRGFRKKMSEELQRARAQVQMVLEELKRERTLIKVRESKRKLADIDENAHDRLVPPSERVPVDQLAEGARVELAGLGTTGTLLEAPQGKRRVRVRIGTREISVSASQLEGVTYEAASGKERKQGESPRPRQCLERPAAQVAEPPAALDLRGRTAEEALDLTIAALDQAVLSGSPWLRLIHGHGTGRLRAVLRDYLKHSPYVASYRPGERAEGGDGVTIVTIRTED